MKRLNAFIWRKRVNYRHAWVLAHLCVTDGKPHVWQWARLLEKQRQDKDRLEFGGVMYHPYPAWVTPFGDVQECSRCHVRRMVNEPTR